MSENIIIGSPFKKPEEEKKEPVAEAPSETPEVVSDAPTTEEVDYKAELEKAEAKLKKAEYTIYKTKKDAKAAVEEDGEAELPPEERINSLVEEKLNERLGKLETSIVSSVLEDELAKVSSNPEETKLIRFHYDNSIRKSGLTRGDVQADLDKARLLANAARYRKQVTELEASAKAKKSIGNTSYGGSQTTSKVEDDYRKHFSAADWDWMQKRGFSKEKIKSTAEAIKASKLR